MATRTTVTLDEDVRDGLRALAARKHQPFRVTINDTIRVGLKTQEQPAPRKPFKVEPKAMGLRPGLNYDKISDLIAYAEGEDYK